MKLKDLMEEFDKRFHNSCWNSGEYEKDTVKSFIRKAYLAGLQAAEEVLPKKKPTNNQGLKFQNTWDLDIKNFGFNQALSLWQSNIEKLKEKLSKGL